MSLIRSKLNFPDRAASQPSCDESDSAHKKHLACRDTPSEGERGVFFAAKSAPEGIVDR